MATHIDKVSADEVDEFIQSRADIYRDLVTLIRKRFDDYPLLVPGRDPIYRVYTRGEKQNGRQLKDTWKIAEKVNLKRQGKRKAADGKLVDVTPVPGFPIQDVGDIVGLTVVCVYPSDITTVRRYVETEIGQGLVQFDGEEKRERGYYAYHYVFGVPEPRFAGLRCEVQIKTLLHDAWSSKTHDTTYKPEDELDPRLKRQIEVLGDALAAIDEQSELLKDLITERWVVDTAKKEVSRRDFLFSIRRLQRPPNPDKAREFEDILTDLGANEDTYRQLPFTSTEVKALLRRIETFLGGQPHNYASCVMVTVLACMRPQDDLDNLALDWVDRWVAAAQSPKDKVNAITFRGLAFFCFGRLEAAIRATNEGALMAERQGLGLEAVRAKANLAYFLTELGESATGKRLNSRGEAYRYMAECESYVARGGALSDPERAKLKDTRGAMLITFGDTAEDIRTGLKMCDEARLDDPDREAADAFFAIHERRAFRRLLSME
jgi:ppGpp synthetase/RelA/SpoT-type nucleotidyltranferase